jgi:formin-binding protein 1
LNQQLSALDRAQKNYEKAFREAERAEDAYRKADADLNLSRADVEKQRINSSIKSHQCDDNKNEYAKQLQKANELQTCHYQVRGKTNGFVLSFSTKSKNKENVKPFLASSS